LNRVDDIVLFNPLGHAQLEKIVDLELSKFRKMLEGRGVEIELTPAARERLLREGYDPAYGARPLRRTLQRLVQDPLALQILDGRILPGERVRVDADPASDQMTFVGVPSGGTKGAQAATAASAPALAAAPVQAKSGKRSR
jgi:ATP-dependent Clp protease ATP-binding subunit ClpB